MSRASEHRYRFSTTAQWNACLLMQTDRAPVADGEELRPFATYDPRPTRYDSPGAHAPVVTRTGEILWLDDEGQLHRLQACDATPETCPPPFTAGRQAPVVSAAGALWLQGKPPESIVGFEEDSLSRSITVDVNGKLLDLTAGRDAIWALVEHEGALQALRIDRSGRVRKSVALAGMSHATHFVYLRRARMFVVLAGVPEHPCHNHQPFQRLFWFAEDGGRPRFSLAVAGLHPCFVADVLASDTRDRVFLGGADDDTSGGRSFVLILDADGNALGDVPIDPDDAPPTGIVANRRGLFVTGARGLLQFTAADAVPYEAAPVRSVVMTPALRSPNREDRRRWLRVEATTVLPEGSTIEIAVAATSKPDVLARMNAIGGDRSVSASRRIAELLKEPDVWRRTTTTIHGSEAYANAPQTLSAKLFDITDPYIWVHVTLNAAPGARLPRLLELAALYPGHTLMEHLPAIYQEEEEQQDSFLRGLVGVLEATTQGLDRRIGSLGSFVHPATAPESWLNFIARWLGVPWDDALGLAQKREILRRAPDLAKGRGTRAGLEALLESLLPGSPRRFRITDATAEFGFAVVGGPSCEGSRLPAMLGGNTRWSAELDSQSVLGYMRLPCPGHVDDGVWQLTGRVRVEIAATAEERTRWQPWLDALLSDMVPLTARLELRWVSAHALRSNRLDDALRLGAEPPAQLGTDAVTGAARLPARGARLSETGPRITTRLQ